MNLRHVAKFRPPYLTRHNGEMPIGSPVSNHPSKSERDTPECGIPAHYLRDHAHVPHQLSLPGHNKHEHDSTGGPRDGIDQSQFQIRRSGVPRTCATALRVRGSRGSAVENPVEISLDIEDSVQQFAKACLELLPTHLFGNVDKVRIGEIETAFGPQ